VRREKKGSGKSSGKARVKGSGWKGQWKGQGQVTTAGGNGSRYRKYRTTVLPIFSTIAARVGLVIYSTNF
jgi:hypothetical protein